MTSAANHDIPMLRHAVATLAYRAAKVLRDPPPDFADFRAAPTTRSAVEILAHMGDLMEWALRAADGPATWTESQNKVWDKQLTRFFAALKSLDDRLASGLPVKATPEKLLQGPIADALTHVGQLATLRRLAGSGIRAESYFLANITIGRVGMDQAPPVREYD